jgi:hypothetical protein
MQFNLNGNSGMALVLLKAKEALPKLLDLQNKPVAVIFELTGLIYSGSVERYSTQNTSDKMELRSIRENRIAIVLPYRLKGHKHPIRLVCDADEFHALLVAFQDLVSRKPLVT